MTTTTAVADVPPIKRRGTARRVWTWILSILGGLILLAVAAFFWFLWIPGYDEPDLATTVETASVDVDGTSRDYISVVPDDLPDGSPLIVAYSGGGSDAAGMRMSTGYRFEELAVDDEFAVVYPEGYENTFNDCRAEGTYPSQVDNIDDVAFSLAIIDQMVADHGIDTDQVFVTGYSNGGQMSLRMAAEAPESIAGFASFAANQPVEDNWDCTAPSEPVPAMFVAGTNDPISPYEGGTITPGFTGDAGDAYSSVASAQFWADTNGATGPEQTTIADDVTEQAWAGDAPVELFTVTDSGHAVPNPNSQFPRIMGGSSDWDGPAAAVEFFGIN